VSDPIEMMPSARIVADAYHKATGTVIPEDVLAERLRIDGLTAGRLLSALHHTEPARSSVPARINGHQTVQETLL
jgi:hypothetical protein